MFRPCRASHRRSDCGPHSGEPANTIQCAVMGKKKDRNVQAPAAKASRATKGFNPWIAGAVLVATVGVGALVLSGGTDEAATPAASATPAADARAVEHAAAQARLGPRKHAALPPIPFQGYAPPR